MCTHTHVHIGNMQVTPRWLHATLPLDWPQVDAALALCKETMAELHEGVTMCADGVMHSFFRTSIPLALRSRGWLEGTGFRELPPGNLSGKSSILGIGMKSTLRTTLNECVGRGWPPIAVQICQTNVRLTFSQTPLLYRLNQMHHSRCTTPPPAGS